MYCTEEPILETLKPKRMKAKREKIFGMGYLVPTLFFHLTFIKVINIGRLHIFRSLFQNFGQNLTFIYFVQCTLPFIIMTDMQL